MIRVTLRQMDDAYELRMEGHAEIAEEDPLPGCAGSPPHRGGEWGNIVCAGASALAYALMGTVLNLRNQGEHVRMAAAEAESGSAWVYCEGDEVAGAVFLSAAVGFLQLEKAHPAHVRVVRL